MKIEIDPIEGLIMLPIGVVVLAALRGGSLRKKRAGAKKCKKTQGK